MIAITAQGVLVLAALSALSGAAALVLFLLRKDPRWLESGRRALKAAWLLVSLALLIFLYLLFLNRVEFAAVYRVTRSALPFAAKISALWGGQTGSLLFWTWLMGGVAFVGASLSWKGADDEKPWIFLFLLLPFACFLLLILFLENPFARWWLLPGGGTLARVFPPVPGAVVFYPGDGAGLNPLLRHPAMIIHPPMLYLGFVIQTLPFAAVMAVLLTRKRESPVFETIRTSSLVGWFFLTLGLILGSRWAYDVLGWGGYWGWDPVEIAGLLPWLSSSALLHLFSLRKGAQSWTLALVLVTFNLMLLGSFLTRSGVVASVHAFAESNLGIALLVIVSAFTLTSLTAWLRSGWPAPADGRRGGFRFWRSTLLSTAGVLIMVLVVCLVGLAVPIFAELLAGQAMMVGAAYYRQATLPLWLLLLLLTATAPFYPRDFSTPWEAVKALAPGALAGLTAALLSAWLLSLPWLEIAVVALAAFFVAAVLSMGVNSSRARRARRQRTASGGAVRFSRRTASALLHAGVFLFALGVLGMEGHQLVGQGALGLGERLDVPGFSIRLDELDQTVTPEGHLRTTAVLALFREAPQGMHAIDVLLPYLEEDAGYDQRTAVPGVYSRLAGDVYALFTGITAGSEPEASLRLLVNPLAGFLWMGGLAMAAGALLFLAPSVFDGAEENGRGRTREPETLSEPRAERD